MNEEIKKAELQTEEKEARAINGMPILILNTLLIPAAIILFISLINYLSHGMEIMGIGRAETNYMLWYALMAVSGLYAFIVGPILYCGLKVLKPKEAYVLTLFGEYYGTLKGPGFFFVNPFVTAFNPGAGETTSGALAAETISQASKAAEQPNRASRNSVYRSTKKISLKTMTLNNDRQKINDQLGNPIVIGIVVIWKVVNTAKAVFNVDNYTEYLSIQCDSALRNIVRLYPYDSVGDDSDNEKSLRGSSQEIAAKLKEEIQNKVEVAGLEIVEARITHLAYAPEIAAAMLQRQQAAAVIDARQMIVDGAVGMVEMALSKLNEKDIVHLDEERKAAMVSNLLVVLCGNKDAQPIVNSGSLY